MPEVTYCKCYTCGSNPSLALPSVIITAMHLTIKTDGKKINVSVMSVVKEEITNFIGKHVSLHLFW